MAGPGEAFGMGPRAQKRRKTKKMRVLAPWGWLGGDDGPPSAPTTEQLAGADAGKKGFEAGNWHGQGLHLPAPWTAYTFGHTI